MKKSYEENGNKIKEVAKSFMDNVKEQYVTGYKKIDEVTGGKLTEIVKKTKDKMAEAKDTFSNALTNIKKDFSDKLTNARQTVDNILGAIGKKFTSIMDTAKNTVKNAIEKIKGFFNFQWKLPKIALPHFSISGKFSLNPPSIPKFSVQWYQKGGVFDNPTLFGYGGRIGGLGENGAEAIVPLEKNTEWLDRLAKMLSSKMGGGNQPIILQVDGKTFAEIAVDSINDLTRQRGSLPLRLI
jgi:hypothetical protein